MGIKSITEVNVPSSQNTISQNAKEIPKELEENDTNNNNIDKKENSNNINNNKDEIQTNHRKSAGINSVNLKNKNNDKNEVKLFLKSSTFNKNIQKNSNVNNNINDPASKNDRQKKLQKAKTCNEIDKINYSVGLNNLGQNHLGVVLEAISEVSNSNVDSSEISIDEDENERNGKNSIKENGKVKEESSTSDKKI